MGDVNTSLLAEHTLKTDHHVDLTKAEMIDYIPPFPHQSLSLGELAHSGHHTHIE